MFYKWLEYQWKSSSSISRNIVQSCFESIKNFAWIKIKKDLETIFDNRFATMIFITGKWPSNLIWFSRNKSATIDLASVYKMCEGIYMSSSTCSVDNLVWDIESRIGVNWHCTLFAKMGKITNWVGHWTLWPLYSQRHWYLWRLNIFWGKWMQ